MSNMNTSQQEDFEIRDVYVPSDEERRSASSLLNSLTRSGSLMIGSARSALGITSASKIDSDKNVILISGSSNEFLRLADKNGDGKVTIEEIEELVKDRIKDERDNKFLKKFLWLMIALLTATILVIAGVTTAVVLLSKDTKTSADDNAIRVSSSGLIAATEKPRTYTLLTELPLLPATALDSLNVVSFTRTDGVYQRMTVSAVKMSSAKPGFLTVYFVSVINSRLEISSTNSTANYIEIDSLGHVTLNVEVLLGATASPAATLVRRSNLFRKLSKLSSISLADMVQRCSITAGACFHTMDEIEYLHDDEQHSNLEVPQFDRKLEVSQPSNTRPAINYAEVNADTAIMKKAGNGLNDVQSFIEKTLGGLPTQDGSTMYLELRVLERCANYPELADKCNSAVIPDLYGVTDPDGLISRMAPYPGLIPSEKSWRFSDLIEYYRDQYTIQMKIRYSHDPKKNYRQHVLLVSISDPSKVISYDLVTTYHDPANPYSEFTVPRTYVMNYLVTVVDSAATATASSTTAGLRRLLSQEDPHHVLQRHMTNKMAGLPHINLDTELLARASDSNEQVSLPTLGKKYDSNVFRRLQVTDIEGAGGVSTDTTITATETTTGVRGTISITKSKNSTNSTLSHAQDFYEHAYNCSIKGVSVVLNSTIADISEPVSIYELLAVESRDGLIAWPLSSHSVTIHEFSASPLVDRVDLNKILNEHVINSTKTGVYYYNSSANRRLLLASEESIIPADEQYMYTEEFFPASLKQMATKYRLDYSDLQQQFRANYKNVVPRHKTKNRILLADTVGQEPTDLHKKIDELKNHMTSLATMIHTYHSATLKYKNDHDQRSLTTSTQSTREKLKVLLGKFLDEKDEDGNSRRSKLRSKALDEADAIKGGIQDFIVGQAMTTFVTTVSNSKKYAYTRGNPSMACRSASSSLETFYDLMDTFVFTLLSGLSDDLSQVINYMGYPGQVKDITGGLITLDELLQVLMPALKMIPYVGGLFNTFGTTYHNAMPPVKDVDKPIGDFNDKLTKITDQIQKVVDVTDLLSAKLGMLMDGLTNAANILLATDGVCPGIQGRTGPTCSILNDAITAASSELQSVVSTYRQAGNFVTNSLLKQFRVLYGFINNPLMNIIQMILNTLVNQVLTPLQGFLSENIGFCYDSICWKTVHQCFTASYPCGVDTCETEKCVKVFGKKICKTIKYPCGTKMCTGSTCVDIPTPYTCQECVSFTVGQILNGISGCAQFVIDFLNDAMSSAASALGITFPEIKIPGLPISSDLLNLPDLAISNLINIPIPALNLPNIPVNALSQINGDKNQILSINIGMPKLDAILSTVTDLVNKAEDLKSQTQQICLNFPVCSTYTLPAGTILPGTLIPGTKAQVLLPGEQITSANNYYLKLNTDGSLVFVNSGGVIVWSNLVVNTPSSVVKNLVMQTNGNLVQYNQNDQVMWQSCLNKPNKNVNLAITSDNVLALFDSNCNRIWQVSSGVFGTTVTGSATCSVGILTNGNFDDKADYAMAMGTASCPSNRGNYYCYKAPVGWTLNNPYSSTLVVASAEDRTLGGGSSVAVNGLGYAAIQWINSLVYQDMTSLPTAGYVRLTLMARSWPGLDQGLTEFSVYIGDTRVFVAWSLASTWKTYTSVAYPLSTTSSSRLRVALTYCSLASGNCALHFDNIQVSIDYLANGNFENENDYYTAIGAVACPSTRGNYFCNKTPVGWTASQVGTTIAAIYDGVYGAATTIDLNGHAYCVIAATKSIYQTLVGLPSTGASIKVNLLARSQPNVACADIELYVKLDSTTVLSAKISNSKLSTVWSSLLSDVYSFTSSAPVLTVGTVGTGSCAVHVDNIQVTLI